MKGFFKRLGASIGRALSALLNIGIPLKFTLILLILAVGASIGLTYSQMMKKVGGKADYDEAMRYIEIKDTIADNYIDNADRVQMGASAAAAMVSGLGDKWSYYMNAEEYRSYQLSSANEYSGIGMSITKDERNGGFQIVSVAAGSAAARAGLNTGHIIMAVDGTDLREMSADEARSLIRSKLNQKFTVSLSGGEVIEIDCKTGYVSPVNYRKEKTEAGYVQIHNFEAGSADDAIAAVEDLLNQNITALCIDLRGNPGGLSSEAQKFLDYLLPAGPLFYIATHDGKEIAAESDSMCVQMPMVVLVNGETYAEAEVFAASLQEHQWATLFGEATTGSTRDQETLELSDGSAIRLSTRSYLTPNHIDISATGGVKPDKIVYNSDPSTVGTTEGTTGGADGTASTSSDEQLIAALTYLSHTNG